MHLFSIFSCCLYCIPPYEYIIFQCVVQTIHMGLSVWNVLVVWNGHVRTTASVMSVHSCISVYRFIVASIIFLASVAFADLFL